MVKKIFLILFIINLLIPNEVKIDTQPNKSIVNSNIIGKIIIPKIDLEKDLYSINSEENNIEKNVTILKESVFPDKENSLMLIAAHSGTGNIAYFNKLDRLKEKDEVYLIINDNYYIYEIKDIWEEKKSGYINLNKEIKKQLVLTTCSPNNNGYQLVINCIEKDV